MKKLYIILLFLFASGMLLSSCVAWFSHFWCVINKERRYYFYFDALEAFSDYPMRQVIYDKDYNFHKVLFGYFPYPHCIYDLMEGINGYLSRDNPNYKYWKGVIGVTNAYLLDKGRIIEEDLINKVRREIKGGVMTVYDLNDWYKTAKVGDGTNVVVDVNSKYYLVAEVTNGVNRAIATNWVVKSLADDSVVTNIPAIPNEFMNELRGGWPQGDIALDGNNPAFLKMEFYKIEGIHSVFLNIETGKSYTNMDWIECVISKDGKKSLFIDSLVNLETREVRSLANGSRLLSEEVVEMWRKQSNMTPVYGIVAIPVGVSEDFSKLYVLAIDNVYTTEEKGRFCDSLEIFGGFERVQPGGRLEDWQKPLKLNSGRIRTEAVGLWEIDISSVTR